MKKNLFIDGKWIEPKYYTELYSPYDERMIAEIPAATPDEVESAIDSAYQATSIMRKMPSHQRATILENLTHLLEERKEEAARIIAMEAAKPINTAKVEVERTIQTYKFAAEEAKRIYGETLPMDAAPGGEGRVAYTVQEPLGVVAAITPFNFPMNLVAHKVGPAIAAGNTVVLKPAAQTPLSAYFLAELCKEAGVPDGGLNVVTGSGSVIGDILVKDERIQKISFTGSHAVGLQIRNKADLKKVTLELGSNAAVIIDENVNVEKIIPRCVSGAFAFQGQVCISLQRIYVHEKNYERFVKEFVEATKKLKLGAPLDPETDISALISPKDVERTLDWIEEAKRSGAEVVAGGISEGNVLQPTILIDVDPSAKVSCQEVFAPIVVINRVQSVEEAINAVNDSRYGLQAGIYTENIHTALNASSELHVGGVIINDIPTYRVDHMPYGGVKESGVGREGIKYAMEEMMEMKLVVINKNK
ncbi:acyl-CoA reductase-like NAD-dependent aldehyde dehydrogenase [Bacillus pakistanensis]|uniref:Acyl-CoA reductase-like NAD-dependent aldehyde dehydrogenase n=1 Tax=Rossellomorea pakistanensis TaxID=992288 RepID=A0ABS2NDZ9_9BACI|nr:aldehyde dehydrogenase family protein [Bacillus pakistanensis]MBM7586077.1 acyl-CoA reductase-like NAD-dependent aldehyde dehydrogenase [Bacillus pakistanensis]